MNNFLKSTIGNEIINSSIMNNNIKLSNDISMNKGVHIYNTINNFICQYTGKLTIEFDNTNAWYWNKNIKLQLTVNDNIISNIKNEIELNNKNKYISLFHKNENIIFVKEKKRIKHKYRQP